jgi:glycosyltransferase involved in cell wall biosynthesis
LPQPHAFIFCSQELQDDVGKQLMESCPDSKQFVIHNGVDTEFFTPTSRSDNKLKRVGIVANLQKRKGHDDFLQMAKQVSCEYQNVHFDIIGGDILQEPREAMLKKLSEDLGISQKITFHGQVDNVKELVAALDILVCASHQEAFPVSILEAMASGKAIVSTNVNGIPEAIEHEKCGLLINPHKPNEMSSAVLTLLNDKSLRSKLASNARQKVVNLFSRRSYAESIQNVYRELI